MNRKTKKYLWDILQSIEQIESHLEGIPDLASFSNNIMVQDAVERRLSIIGEAAYRLQKMDIKLQHADGAINRRNTIVHQYDDFSERSIWRHVVEDLPNMKQEVKEMLGT